MRLLMRKRFSENSASMLMLNLLSALDYLHQNQIVHRDIKLENILMVDPADDTKILLADFGLCSDVDGAYLQSKCGSPGYMAPELIHGPDYGTKVDIFSAGIILYILLAGVAPFPGKNEDEVLRRNIKGEIFFPEKYWKSISPEAIDLVLKMTDNKPTSR